ncbi:stage V sporulation protein AA [Aneurinibacillus uraniidurans]|uniref:stage V sporulation protein AA n=1 Tax=Aneurinibacillus uraniidurans TaxID=2966586 RepID=UPI00234AAF0B|nr:stage V sporulation protein AA [Aneurinibacillus sp. B1]WCN36844.1 stage V sporulation protein AA [Aneurinibacillus sp. B1]
MADLTHVYVKLKGKVKRPPGTMLRVGDVADVLTDSPYESVLQDAVLHVLRIEDGNRYVVDMMHVIRAVRAVVPDADVHGIGAGQMLVEIESPKRPANLLLVAFVWLVLFIGSALAIMNFHTDVSMQEVHQRVYELVTGHKSEHPFILQIPYSIGVGAGMILFFNHLFRKRFNEEPSPLELEMFLYQQNLDDYVLTHEAPGGEHHERGSK